MIDISINQTIHIYIHVLYVYTRRSKHIEESLLYNQNYSFIFKKKSLYFLLVFLMN